MKSSEKLIQYWAPLVFYLSNVVTWMIIALAAKLWHLIWLAILPLFVALIYLAKIRRTKQ